MKKPQTLLSVLLLLALLLTTLAGCSTTSAPTTVATTTASPAGDSSQPAAGQHANLTVWAWDVALAQLQEAAATYTAQHPEVTFTFEDMGTDQIYSKLVTSLATGAGLPDIVALEGEQMSGFGNKFPDKFLDLGDVVEADKHLPIKISEATVNGKIIAFPWDAAPIAMFYRTDLFEQAGIAAADLKTWDDFIAAGQKLQQATGVAMMPLATSTRDTLYRTMLSQLGSFYFDAAGNTQLNSEPSIQAMTMVKKIYDAGITVDYSGWDEYVQTIADEKVATIPEAVWMIGSIKDAAPQNAGNWGVMPLPGFGTDSKGATNGGSLLAIPAVSANATAAKDFLKFAMTDEDSLINGFVNYGLYPSYIPAYQNEIFTQGDDYFGGQKIYEIFNTYGQTIPMVNYTQNFAEAMDMNKNSVAQILLEGADVTATMNAIQAEMQAKFGK